MSKIKGAKQKERYNFKVIIEKRNRYGKSGIMYLFFLQWQAWYRHGEQRVDQFRFFEELLEVSKLGVSPEWVEQRRLELSHKYPENIWNKS